MRRRTGAATSAAASSARYRRAMIGMAVVALVLRLWWIDHGTWGFDGWNHMGRVPEMSFLGYLFQNYNGHFMPGQFLLIWVTTTLAPLEHSVVMVISAVWAALNVVVWGLALGELAGRRARTLAPLALVAFTPLLIEPTLDWGAALQTLSYSTAMALCVYMVVRLVRSRARRGLRGLAVTLVLALLMSEKALLLGLVVVPLVFFLETGTAGEVLRRHARTWRVLGAVVAGYVALYLLGRALAPVTADAAPADADRGVGAVAGFYFELLGHLLAPGMLGGPWTAVPTLDIFVARPGSWVVALTLVVVVGALAWALVTRERAWLPIGMAAAYTVVAWTLILFGSRFPALQEFGFGYERHAVDIFAVWCLALAMVMMLPASVRAARLPALRGGVVGPRLGIAALVLLVASLTLANALAISRAVTSPAMAWQHNVMAGLDTGRVMTLVDTPAPPAVMSAVYWGEEARLSYLLSPLGERVRFGGASETLSMVTDEGHVQPVKVEPASRSVPGPVPECGYRVAPGQVVEVRMDKPLHAWSWGVQVQGYTDEDTSLSVSVEDDQTELTISRGINTDKFTHDGKIEVVTLSAPEDGADVCVTDVFAGPLVPETAADTPDAG